MKFIDLKDMIHAETRDQVYLDEVGEVLEWLDDHPDQVPGRTITESEYRHAMLAATDTEDFDAEELLRRLGLTIVPDPDPTNAEKLEALLEGGDINAQWGLRGGGVMFARELAHALDEAGVTAPGGEGDD